MTTSNRNRWLEDKAEVRMLTDVESAWLAGVVDGEGSIGLYDFGKQGRRASIQMGNTSEAYVARMREIIGCGSTVYRTMPGLGPGHLGTKPMYHYVLKGSLRCYKILKQIEPYLIIKRNKALTIIAFLEERPFGRFANCELDARATASEKKRQWWADLTHERRTEIRENMRRARWGKDHSS
jgi:hypothetical protein